MPVFDGLFKEPHNSSVLNLLSLLCSWHGLAKLRMHTDETLQIMDDVTISLGRELRAFCTHTCPTFPTRELKREAECRQRRQQQSQSRSVHKSSQAASRKLKTLNLQTYKLHALGDYVSSIKRYGTTDSYSTQLVRKCHGVMLYSYSCSLFRENESTE